MTATVVSAVEGMRDHRGSNHGEHNFRNWHKHRHHDHYYGGTYCPDYEWVYNPATLVWNYTYLPVVVEQPVVTQPS